MGSFFEPLGTGLWVHFYDPIEIFGIESHLKSVRCLFYVKNVDSIEVIDDVSHITNVRTSTSILK